MKKKSIDERVAALHDKCKRAQKNLREFKAFLKRFEKTATLKTLDKKLKNIK